MSILQIFGSVLIISAVVIVRLFEEKQSSARRRQQVQCMLVQPLHKIIKKPQISTKETCGCCTANDPMGAYKDAHRKAPDIRVKDK